jgi:hypothetical protein
LTPPPLNEDGSVKPHDHAEILQGDLLIRRIDPQQHIVPDENRNCRRLSSKAFQPSSGEGGGMSVDIERLISDAGLVPSEFVTSSPKHAGAVAFPASVPRADGLLVGYDPLPDNPYHAEVWGGDRPNRFSNGQRKAIAKSAQWFVQIDGVEIT